MNFEYNTTRSELILAEYGRNVQNMVKYIIDLPDLEERNKYAQAVIDLMGFLNPHLRDVADFKHKLWDHLHIISGYKIDVDSPYPKPTPEGARLSVCFHDKLSRDHSSGCCTARSTHSRNGSGSRR